MRHLISLATCATAGLAAFVVEGAGFAARLEVQASAAVVSKNVARRMGFDIRSFETQCMGFD
jgi:hypothetical protein